jgi:hypothetical protein
MRNIGYPTREDERAAHLFQEVTQQGDLFGFGGGMGGTRCLMQSPVSTKLHTVS